MRRDKIKGHEKSEAHKLAMAAEVRRNNAEEAGGQLQRALHVQETLQRKAMKGETP
jgi:hypothetical protein